MKPIEGDIEEMAEESARDVRDLADLTKLVEELAAHEDAMRIPVMVRRLIDMDLDPVVVAKTMLIGDRQGNAFYALSSRAHSLTMHERHTERMLAIAIENVAAVPATQMLVAGAVWLATQFEISRTMLADLARAAAPRPASLGPSRHGYGAVDLVDHFGVRDRAWLVDAIANAQLPLYAPLEFSPT